MSFSVPVARRLSSSADALKKATCTLDVEESWGNTQSYTFQSDTFAYYKCRRYTPFLNPKQQQFKLSSEKSVDNTLTRHWYKTEQVSYNAKYKYTNSWSILFRWIQNINRCFNCNSFGRNRTINYNIAILTIACFM